MIWRSWVQTQLGLNLGCIVLVLSRTWTKHIFFLNLQITRSDIRPHMKWAMVPLIFLRFVSVCMGQTYSLYHPRWFALSLSRPRIQFTMFACYWAGVDNVLAPRLIGLGMLLNACWQNGNPSLLWRLRYCTCAYVYLASMAIMFVVHSFVLITTTVKRGMNYSQVLL